MSRTYMLDLAGIDCGWYIALNIYYSHNVRPPRSH